MRELLEHVDLDVNLVNRAVPIDRWWNGDELECNITFLYDLLRMEDLLPAVGAKTFDDQEWSNTGIFHRINSQGQKMN